MNYTKYITQRIAARDRFLDINDDPTSSPEQKIIANAKAEQIVDDIAEMYKEIKEKNEVLDKLIDDVFGNTFYIVQFKS
jgi:hypothetical protein